MAIHNLGSARARLHARAIPTASRAGADLLQWRRCHRATRTLTRFCAILSLAAFMPACEFLHPVTPRVQIFIPIEWRSSPVILGPLATVETKPLDLERPCRKAGVASWYGPGFHGRRTASGEIYNQEGLTAASLTLPLGSLVRITREDGLGSLVVRVNDRGPYVAGRAIDLSHRAAVALGMVRQGLARVCIDPL